MEEIEDFENIDVLRPSRVYYSYVGFKLGKFDTENSVT